MLVCAAGIGNVIRPALSVEWAVQAVAASRRLGDVQRLLRSLIDLCYRYLWALQDTALTAATLAEADEIFDELAPHQLSPEVHRAWEARLTVLRANVAFQENRLDDALRDSLLAVERFEAADELGNAVDTRTLVADVLVKLGEFEAGRRHLLAGLRQTEHFTHRGRDIAAGFLLRCLGLLEVRAGQPAEGQRHCQASLRRAARVSEYNLIASDLAILAISMAQLEDRQMAARLAGAAQTAYARHGHKPWEDSTLETLMPGWQARPDQAAIGAAFTAGTALTIEDALALALALALPVPPAGRA
jgi:hypothetical protein